MYLDFWGFQVVVPRHVLFQNRSTPEIDGFLMEIRSRNRILSNKWELRKRIKHTIFKKIVLRNFIVLFFFGLRHFLGIVVFLWRKSARHEIKTCHDITTADSNKRLRPKGLLATGFLFVKGKRKSKLSCSNRNFLGCAPLPSPPFSFWFYYIHCVVVDDGGGLMLPPSIMDCIRGRA
jgi:hypothetical protein